MNPEPILLVDVGNSRVKWGLGKAGRVLAGEPFSSAPGDLRGELERCWRDLPAPVAAVVANVTGRERGETLRDWMHDIWGVETRFVAAQRSAGGVLNGYEEPAALGVDRWVGILGARHLCKEPVCVADCGTALTLDAMDAEGRHLGGLIAPGLGLLRRSLVQGTQGLQHVAGGRAGVFARNTGDAVQGGTLQMAAGAVERFLRQAERRVGRMPRLLLTGGDAETIAGELRVPFLLVPDLILSGLLLIAEGDA